MPAVRFDVSVEHAFNFQDDQGPIGHITSLQIGTADTLAADVSLKNPLDGSDVSVVGPLSAISWGGGPGDQMDFEVAISNDNHLKTKLETQAHTPFGASLDFSVVVYDYDQAKQQWFVAFQGAASGAALNSLVTGFSLNSSPSTPSIPWQLAAEVTPQPAVQGIVRAVQEVKLATTVTAPLMKPWGVIALSPPGGASSGSTS